MGLHIRLSSSLDTSSSLNEARGNPCKIFAAGPRGPDHFGAHWSDISIKVGAPTAAARCVGPVLLPTAHALRRANPAS